MNGAATFIERVERRWADYRPHHWMNLQWLRLRGLHTPLTTPELLLRMINERQNNAELINAGLVGPGVILLSKPLDGKYNMG